MQNKTALVLFLLSVVTFGACSLPGQPSAIAIAKHCAPFGSAEWQALNERQATLYNANGQTVNAEQQNIIDQMCDDPHTVLPLYTCTTKPRLYILPNGTAQYERDTYTSNDPCPEIPID